MLNLVNIVPYSWWRGNATQSVYQFIFIISKMLASRILSNVTTRETTDILRKLLVELATIGQKTFYNWTTLGLTERRQRLLLKLRAS